jgi:hypothetical protein
MDVTLYLRKVRNDWQPYGLTKIVRRTIVELRYVQWTQVNMIVVGDAAFSGSPGDAQRIIQILTLTDGVEHSPAFWWDIWIKASTPSVSTTWYRSITSTRLGEIEMIFG